MALGLGWVVGGEEVLAARSSGSVAIGVDVWEAINEREEGAEDRVEPVDGFEDLVVLVG